MKKLLEEPLLAPVIAATLLGFVSLCLSHLDPSRFTLFGKIAQSLSDWMETVSAIFKSCHRFSFGFRSGLSAAF